MAWASSRNKFFHKSALDMRWSEIGIEARSTKLASVISFPTIASGIIDLLKRHQNIETKIKKKN